MKDKYFGAHEFQNRGEEVVKTSSDRSFGLVFAGFFTVVGVLSLIGGGHRWPYWFGAAVVFALVAFTIPHVLAPLNRLWTKFGLLLHMIVSPVILGLLYYVFITPVGFLMRTSGTDPLRLRYDPDAESYWIRRDPPGPAPDTFKNQF